MHTRVGHQPVAVTPVTPYPTGRISWGIPFQALRARLRSFGPYGDAASGLKDVQTAQAFRPGKAPSKSALKLKGRLTGTGENEYLAIHIERPSHSDALSAFRASSLWQKPRPRRPGLISFNRFAAIRRTQRLVHRLAYNGDVAAGQLAVFQGGPSRTGGRRAHI